MPGKSRFYLTEIKVQLTILYNLILSRLILDRGRFIFYRFRRVGRLIHKEYGLQNVPEICREICLQLVGYARDADE